MKNLSYEVVIPSIGRDTLDRSIKSVLSQTVIPQKIIVVGFNLNIESSDKITYVNSQTMVKAGIARAIGTNEVKSEYVTYLDDDDYWLPNNIESRIAEKQEFSSDSIYNCSAIVDSNFGRFVVPRCTIKDGQGIRTYLFGRISLVPGKYYFPSAGLLMKTDLAKKIGWRDMPHDDWDFLLRAEQIGVKFEQSNTALVVIDQTQSSESRTSNINRCKIFLSFHKESFTKHELRNYLTGVTLQSAINGRKVKEIIGILFEILKLGVFHKTSLVIITRIIPFRNWLRTSVRLVRFISLFINKMLQGHRITT